MQGQIYMRFYLLDAYPRPLPPPLALIFYGKKLKNFKFKRIIGTVRLKYISCYKDFCAFYNTRSVIVTPEH